MTTRRQPRHRDVLDTWIGASFVIGLGTLVLGLLYFGLPHG